MGRYLCLRESNVLLQATMGMTVLFVFLTIAATPVRAGHYFRYDEDIRGQVFDADTRQPLAGVVVMVMWVTEHTRITIEPEERYYDYVETLTDANGEFTIPGKGRNFFRNMPPPKIRIYKAGYPLRDIRFAGTESGPGYPWNVNVSFKDGKRIVAYKKFTPVKRKKQVEHYRAVPYSEMARARVPADQYHLYTVEREKDYHALGIRPWRPGAPVRVMKGGVHPVTHQSVAPQKAQ